MKAENTNSKNLQFHLFYFSLSKAIVNSSVNHLYKSCQLCGMMFCALGSVFVIFLHYGSIGPLMKPSSDPGVIDYSRYAEAGEIIVNSPVIAVAISPAKAFPLDHVTFTLKHNEVLNYIQYEACRQQYGYINWIHMYCINTVFIVLFIVFISVHFYFMI